MLKKFRLLIVGLFLIAPSVNAGLITDTVVQNEKLSTGFWDAISLNFDSHSYTHVLNEAGEDTFILGSAISAILSIDIIDDSSRDTETVSWVIEALDLDSDGLELSWKSSANEVIQDIEIKGLAALNSDGELDVTVSSLIGDFWVGNSILTITTSDVAVPEPSILALFGAGLFGMGYLRRRRFNA